MTIDSTAFDAFAGTYDDDFTRSPLGRLLRPRVWEVLAAQFPAGSHVLELACGTGEDAVWLARRDVRVTATDGAAAMVRVARAKAEAAGVAAAVSVQQASLQDLCTGAWSPSAPAGAFTGVFSNFGGLNVIGDWRPLARALARWTRPGAKAVLVPMGPVCPWEIGWSLLHGQGRQAFRRCGGPAAARIGDATIPIWYPSARRLRDDFAPWFRPLHTESLGLWLPPSYLGHLVAARPGLFAHLSRLERATASLTGGWGDHYILVLARTRVAAPGR